MEQQTLQQPFFRAILIAGLAGWVGPAPAQETQATSRSALAQVESLCKERKVEDGLRLLEQSLAEDESDQEAWKYKGAILRHLKRLDEELACWKKYTELFGRDPYGWRRLAGVQMRAAQTRSSSIPDRAQTLINALDNVDRSIDLAPKEAEGYLNRGECHFLMGLYDEAWDDLESAKRVGSVDETVQTYTAWLKRVRRQFGASEIPPKGWKPNYDDYLNIVTLRDFGGMLVGTMTDEKGRRPLQPTSSQAAPTLGLPGSKMAFEGSEAAPVQFAPGFQVWQGAWINDPKFGLLLDNGTRFKYIRVRPGTLTSNLGHVENWTFVIDEKLEGNDLKKARSESPGRP